MNFKVGDRVKVYGNAGDHPGGGTGYYLRGQKGKVVAITNDSELQVKIFDTKFKEKNPIREVHPKQLRKLKVRAPRRVFILEGELAQIKRSPGRCEDIQVSDRRILPNDVEFVEVRSKKK
jgi:ribosomal protein L21E